MATGLILFLPIVRAGVRYLERRGSDRQSAEELSEMREQLRLFHERLDSVESDGHRLTELEERVEFAERMLAQRRDAPRIEGSD
jgi:hypothetical protein